MDQGLILRTNTSPGGHWQAFRCRRMSAARRHYTYESEMMVEQQSGGREYEVRQGAAKPHSVGDATKVKMMTEWRQSTCLQPWQVAELLIADEEWGPQWWETGNSKTGDESALTPRERAWQETHRPIGTFKDEHDRWPSQSATDVAEKQDGRRLNKLRVLNNATPSQVPEPRRKFMDLVAPGWHLDAQNEEWRRKCDELVAFVAEHGQYPSGSSNDSGERSLAAWLSSQRKASVTTKKWHTEKRGEHLDALLPGWADGTI
jgi:hypothetical protein